MNTPLPHSNNSSTVLLAQISRLDSAIEKEFSLVSDRMNWMLFSESAIFAAFSASVINYDHSKHLAFVIAALIFALPILGILIAGCLYLAILAAHTSSKKLKINRRILEASVREHLRVHLVHHSAKTHLDGNIPDNFLARLSFNYCHSTLDKRRNPEIS